MVTDPVELSNNPKWGRLLTDGGESGSGQSTTRRGIKVTKHIESEPSEDSNDVQLQLKIENRTAKTKQARIEEDLPTGCRPSATQVEKADDAIWSVSDTKERLTLAVEVESNEKRSLSYGPHIPRPAVFEKLASRPPRITSVRTVEDSVWNQFIPSSEDDTGRSTSDGKAVDDDHEYVDPPPEMDFTDVAGFDSLKRELHTEVIEPFVDPRYEQYDIGKANGVLLYGPPGTGKTHIATALAGELGFNFLESDMGMLRDSKLGSNIENIQELFEMAEKAQPCVMFLDEIDSLAPNRDGNLHHARQEAVNEMLQRVADINARDADILIVAATNRPDRVDDALKRTGRFDTRLKVGMPDDMTRVAILEEELRKFDGAVEPIWTDVEFLDRFADATSNFVSSDIIEVVESAQRASLRRSRADVEPIVTADLIMEQVADVGEKQEADTAGEFLTETPEIDFSDVGGMDATKERLKETLLEPLEDTQLYETYGLGTTNGVLLYGPPGTGKTYLSKATAGESDCAFLSITASDVVSKWVGEAAQNIQQLFEKARKVEPAIVFIDEIDAIANERGGINQTNTEAQAVNELLTQISSLDDVDVFIIGATNRPDIIDDALLRSGRLGEKIEVPPPDDTARVAMLKEQLAGRPFNGETIEWAKIKSMTKTGPDTSSYVAADLAKITDEAARLAMEEADEEIQPITQRHLEAAIATVDPSLADIS